MTVSPGVYTVRFAQHKERAGPEATGEVKLTVEPAVVGWGRAKDGLEFGVALGKGQSSRIHLGERARFRLLARNTTDRPVTIAVMPARTVPEYAEPVSAGDKDAEKPVVHFVRGPKYDPPGPNLTVPAGQTVEVPGEFTVPFLPHPAEGETHIVARPGKLALAFPKLHPWTIDEGYDTGRLDLEIVPGDVAHTDGQRVAWGPVADGLQFGLRAERDDYRLGDTVKFTVLARNMAAGEASFAFPQLAGWWPNNGRPVVRDADGKDVPAYLAPPLGPIGPQAATPHKLRPGQTAELTTVAWPFLGPADPRPKDRDHVPVAKAGVYTFQYPDLHARNKPAWPTGAVRLTFDDSAAPARNNPLAGSWRLLSEVIDGMVVADPDWLGFECDGRGHVRLRRRDDIDANAERYTVTVGEAGARKTIALRSSFNDEVPLPLVGIYDVAGDRLTVCLDPTGRRPPAAFVAPAGSGLRLVVFEAGRSRSPGGRSRTGSSSGWPWAAGSREPSASARRSGSGYGCGTPPTASGRTRPRRRNPSLSSDPGGDWRRRDLAVPREPAARPAGGSTARRRPGPVGEGSGRGRIRLLPGPRQREQWAGGQARHVERPLPRSMALGGRTAVCDRQGRHGGQAGGRGARGQPGRLLGPGGGRPAVRTGPRRRGPLGVQARGHARRPPVGAELLAGLKDVALPTPDVLWLVGVNPVVRDAKGNAVRLEVPTVDRAETPQDRKCDCGSGSGRTGARPSGRSWPPTRPRPANSACRPCCSIAARTRSSSRTCSGTGRRGPRHGPRAC